MHGIDFIAIDLETATWSRDSICEVGLAFVEDGKVVNSESWLVRPPGNRYDAFNISIHGITPEMTRNSPGFREIWDEILHPLLEGRILVAHNSSFDMYAIQEALIKHRIPFPDFKYYCSLRIARKAFPGLRSYSLPLLCRNIGIEFSGHHRAGNDAEGCAYVFLKSLQSLGVSNIDDLENIINIKKGSFSKTGHIPQKQTARWNPIFNTVNVKEIKADLSKRDENNYFYGKEVCLTGTFSSGSRQSLLQDIADIGGIPANSVTRRTNVLVVGRNETAFPKISGLSTKHKKALTLIEKGQDLEIMSEDEFIRKLKK